MSSSFSSLPVEKQLLVVLSILAVSIPVLVFTFFGIYYLVLDVDVCESYSNLWIFGVVTFGFLACSVPARILLSKVDYGKSTRSFFAAIHPKLKPDWFIWLPIWLSWLCYGAVIIYGNGYVCSDMKSHGLYYWALVTFWLNVAVAVLLVCLLFFDMLCRKRNSLPYEGSDEERAALRS